MKPNCLPVVHLAWYLSLILCICCASHRAHAQDTAPPSAIPLTAPTPATASRDDLRKQAEDLKLKDPKASAALYAQLVAADTAPAEESDDIDNQADELLKVSDWKTAEPLARKVLETQKQASDQTGEARSMRIIADILTMQGKYQEAIDLCQSSLAIDRSVRATSEEANALGAEGGADAGLSQYTKALSEYTEALSILQKTGDQDDQIDTLFNVGQMFVALNQFSKALDYSQRSLQIARKINDFIGEAKALAGLGVTYKEMSQYPKALACFQQSLPIQRQIGSKSDEASILDNIGAVDDDLGRYTEALINLKQALIIRQQIEDQIGEGQTLNDIASVYDDLSQYANALEFYRPALAIAQKIGDKEDEANTFSNLGQVYEQLSQYEKSLDSLHQSLVINRQIGDIAGEAEDLNSLGAVYADLGQYSTALYYQQQSLLPFHKIGDKKSEEASLNNIGNTYEKLDQYVKSLFFLLQALRMERQVGDQASESTTLDNIGLLYNKFGHAPQALDYLQQALHIERQIGDKGDEFATLNSSGEVFRAQRQCVKALKMYQEALLIEQQIGAKAAEADTLNNVLTVWKTLKSPRVAVFYGKKSVNAYQSIRANIRGIDKESRKTYVTTHAAVYHNLADLLIQQGRLPEAQQVLRLLKDQEFYDFLHTQGNGNDTAVPAEPLALTPRERRWSNAYDAASTHLKELQARYEVLDRIAMPTPANKVKLASLKSQINAADASVTTLLAKTVKSFAEPVSQQDRLPGTAIAGDVAAALKPGEATLYTIVSPDRLDLILILPPKRSHATTPKVYSSPIKQTDLYSNVYRLRTALTDPHVDPRPLAASLYDLVLRPVKRDLVAAHTRTILFSLDDALRYIPPAVLYDNETKRYVVQDYATALITLAGNAPTSQKTALAPKVIGAGVSQSPGSTDPPLPGVRKELDGIVHQTGDAKTSGVYPGTRMLDQQFTRAALEGSLAAHRYPMVHLASHFLLHDTDADSYLLLGDGTQLSVQEIRQDPKRFADVDLLTLSACDTAMEVKSSTGREVEGLGALAQSLGAKAVLASLWPVSDTETPKLMIAFYAYHKAYPRVALPEALRQAQLSLLARRGARPGAEDGARGTKMVGTADRTLPAFKADASRADAHPDYWAPFILLGNWK